jgi:IS30 family transposase
MAAFTKGTQARVAEELGKHPSTISRAVREERPASREVWQAAQRIDTQNRQLLARENVQRTLHTNFPTGDHNGIF